MRVKARRVAKIKGLAGGEVGRKNSAQLFLLLHIFADSLGNAAMGNVHLGNLL